MEERSLIEQCHIFPAKVEGDGAESSFGDRALDGSHCGWNIGMPSEEYDRQRGTEFAQPFLQLRTVQSRYPHIEEDAARHSYASNDVPSPCGRTHRHRQHAHHEVTRGLKSKLDLVRSHIATLTPREREVFALIVRGNTNKHIARALGATERTIKAHRHRVMEKMQVQSLAELVSLAERVGVLDSASGSRQTA
jgi:DNA-binding CsgD family transcriptional regulator